MHHTKNRTKIQKKSIPMYNISIFLSYFYQIHKKENKEEGAESKE